MRQLRFVAMWVAALSIMGIVAGCDGDPPRTDSGVTLLDSGPGMVDSGPGMVDAGPGMVDSGPGMVDSGPGGTCTGPAGPCDVLNASSCGAGMACVFVGSSATMWESMCIASGAGVQGSACTGLEQCAEGFECSSSSGVCEKICCTTADCSPGDFCGLIAGTGVGTCSTPDDCDLLMQTGCTTGQACYPSSGGLSCLPAGTLGAGEACMFTNDCMPGFGCLGPAGGAATCRAWCDMAADPTTCPSGQTCGGVTGLPVGACG